MKSKNRSAVKPELGGGVYTLPDAAKILNIDLPKLRRWVNSYNQLGSYTQNILLPGKGAMVVWGNSFEKGFNFLTLVELFTIMALRDLGVSFHKIRKAREELMERFGTNSPFASHKLMSDGSQVIVKLKDSGSFSLLTLGTNGQTSFRKIIEPFCSKLDFDDCTELAERYWPMGKNSSVIVDPHHGFGRPTILNTNIATETVYNLVQAGEDSDTIEDLYGITYRQVSDVISFETRAVA